MWFVISPVCVSPQWTNSERAAFVPFVMQSGDCLQVAYPALS